MPSDDYDVEIAAAQLRLELALYELRSAIEAARGAENAAVVERDLLEGLTERHRALREARRHDELS